MIDFRSLSQTREQIRVSEVSEVTLRRRDGVAKLTARAQVTEAVSKCDALTAGRSCAVFPAPGSPCRVAQPPPTGARKLAREDTNYDGLPWIAPDGSRNATKAMWMSDRPPGAR
jgi:hypothetical protein